MSYPIKGLTNKEQKVLTSIAGFGMDDYCAWVHEISEDTEMDYETIIGVVGSLTKKGYVTTEDKGSSDTHTVSDIFFCLDGEELCYGDESGRFNDEQMKIVESVANYRFAEEA